MVRGRGGVERGRERGRQGRKGLGRKRDWKDREGIDVDNGER